jgi:ribosome-associated toxin RatA of RatAB toxin-antitoxin module
MKIERTALVTHPASEMYQLVRDVAAYPEFLKWCVWSKIHEQSEDHQLASLGVAVAGVKQEFTTRNTLVPDKSLHLSLVDGPFRDLKGEWQFTQLGDRGSKISLTLNFDFKAGLLSSAFQQGFKRIADRLVQEFCQRADALSESKGALSER